MAEPTVTITGRKRPYWRVSPAFWTDEKVLDWDQDTRYLALYILTCPHRNLEGLFRLPKGYIMDDLQWSPERLGEPFRVLLDEGFIEYDGRARLCLIVNALEYQSPDNDNYAKAGVKQLAELPKSGLFTRLLELAELHCQPLAKALREGLPERYGEPLSSKLLTLPLPHTSDDLKTDGGTDVSPGAKSAPEDEPVENPSETDDFAGIDFGDEDAGEAEKPNPPSQERGASPPTGKKRAAKTAPEINPQDLVDLFHKLCPSLPRVQALTVPRRDRLLRTHKQMGPDGLAAFFRRVEASDFLAGRKKEWRADIDFILGPKNMQRILEGIYDNRSARAGVRSNVAAALAIVERCEQEAMLGVSG